MLNLLIAVAPGLAILLYIYYRDKYEKEPGRLLLKLFFMGCLATVPAAVIELITLQYSSRQTGLFSLLAYAFLGVALVEEGVKYLVLKWLVWKNIEFTEMFDGIVYSVFVSLGFATLENILYVITGGMGVGIVRAVISVPAHALFAITMGYYMGLAKFARTPGRMTRLLFLGLIVPVILHGLFDFLLLAQMLLFTLLFIPFVIYLYIDGIRKTNRLS